MNLERSIPPYDSHFKNLYYITVAIYVLWGLSIFSFGTSSIIAVLINYIKKDDVRGTWLESHFSWQIKTFWVTAFFSLIGSILFIFGIGMIILVIIWIWAAYRVLKGFFTLTDRKEII